MIVRIFQDKMESLLMLKEKRNFKPKQLYSPQSTLYTPQKIVILCFKCWVVGWVGGWYTGNHLDSGQSLTELQLEELLTNSVMADGVNLVFLSREKLSIIIIIACHLEHMVPR